MKTQKFLTRIFIIFFFFGCLNQVGFSQFSGNEITVNVNIVPPYSAKLYKYAKLEKRIIITLINNTSSTYSIMLTGSIEGDNGVEVYTKEGYRPSSPIIVPPGTRVLNSENANSNFLDKNNVEIVALGKIKNMILKDGIIPEGMYSFCIQALDYNTGASLSQPSPLGCTTISIAYLQPPVIVNPIDESDINTNLPQFSWTPVMGNLGANTVSYELYILKLQQSQNPDDAMLQAVNYNVGNPLKKTLLTTNYVYLPSDWPLEENATYAVQVVASVSQNQLPIVNDGKSEVITFVYTSSSSPTPPPNQPVQPIQFACDCNGSLPQGNAQTNFTVNPNSTFQLGEYTVTVTNILGQPGNNGAFSGEGTIPFPLSNAGTIPVEITFSDIKINSSNEAIEGFAIADVSTNAGFIPESDPADELLSLSTTQAQDLKSYFQVNPTQLVGNASGSPKQLPLGINNVVNGNTNIVAITGLYFTPTNASFDAAIAVDIPDASPNVVAFGKKYICFSGTDICNSQASLLLENDVVLDMITSQADITLKGWNANGSQPADSGTYVTFDKNGFKKLRIHGIYDFPVTQVTGSDGVGQISAAISANASAWSDWIGDLEFTEPFIANDLNDFIFDVNQPALLDHSDLHNPQNIPGSYSNSDPSANLPDWKGILIPSGQVSFPGKNASLTDNGPVDIAAQNIVIDNQGISVNLVKTNILDITEGNLADWKFSIENLNLNLFKNSLTQGDFSGKLLLPIAHDTSYLSYTCALSINNGNLEYQFVVDPRDDLKVPMWKAKMDIEQSSTIDIQFASGAFQATANLNGVMDISGQNVGQLKKLKLNGMEFQNLSFGSQSNTLSLGTCSEGSSGKKKLAGFTLKIKNVIPVQGPKPGIQVVTDVVLLGNSSKPLANTTFTIEGRQENTDRKKYVFDDAILDSIKIEGNLAVVKIKGTIIQYDEDPTYGDGFRGEIQAIFPPKEAITVSCVIQFGEISQADTFKYWYVDGAVDIKNGIPLFPGVKAYGFSGGAYYHMQRDQTIPEDIITQDPSQFNQIGTSPSGVNYTPNNSIMFGLKAGLVFGLEERKTFQADVRFEIDFTESGGLGSIYLDGEAKALCENDKGKNAMITGLFNAQYNHKTETFHANLKGNVNMKAITASIPIQIHFDPDNWYIWAGRPTPDSARCKVSIAGFLNFTSYFQCGTMLDPMPPVPQFIQAILERANVPSNFLVSERSQVMGSTEGMIFGGSMEFHYSGTFLIFKGSLDAGVGFDLAIRKFTTDCDGNPTNDPIGIGGWYADGQIYAGIAVMLAIHIDLGFFDKDIKIFEAGAAAVLKGGLVNPTWVKGVIAGYFEVLDGLIKGDFHYKFSHGQECVPTAVDALEGVQLLADIYPLEDSQGDSNEELGIDIHPSATANFKISSTPFTLEQADHETGEITYRVFRFTSSLISIQLSANNNQESVSKIIDPEGFGFMISPNSMLRPESDYTLTITATVEERIDGEWQQAQMQNGTPFEEVHTIAFTTNEGLDEIDDSNIKYTIPDQRQRNFCFNDYNQGYMETRQNIDYYHFNIPVDLNDYNIEYIAKFVPLGGLTSNAVEVPLQDENRRFSFQIPSNLNPSTIYCMQMLARWTPKAQTTSTMPLLLYNVHDLAIWNYQGSEITKTTRELNMQHLEIDKNEKKLYSLYFRTSKYGTVAEKVQTMEINEAVFATNVSNPVLGESVYDYDYVYMDKNEMADNADMISGLKQKLGVPQNEQLKIIYPHDICMGGEEPFDFLDVYGHQIVDEFNQPIEVYDPNTKPRVSLDVQAVDSWARSVYDNIINILTAGGDMEEMNIPGYNEKIGGFIFEKTMQIPTAEPLTDQEIFDGVERIVFQDMENICRNRIYENTVTEAPVQNASSGMVTMKGSNYAYAKVNSSMTNTTSKNVSNQAYNAPDQQYMETYAIGGFGYNLSEINYLKPNHINLTYEYKYKGGRGIEMAPNLFILDAMMYTDPSPELNNYSRVGQAYDAAQTSMGNVNIGVSNVSASFFSMGSVGGGAGAVNIPVGQF